MRNYFEDEEEENEHSDNMPDRMFDIRDLFQEEDGDIADYRLAHLHINYTILGHALRMLEGSLWWRFRSHKSKMDLLRDTYTQLQKLLAINIEEENEE